MRLLLLVIPLLFIQCLEKDPKQPNPNPTPGPITPPEQGDCADICDRLRSMNCPQAETTDEGETCETVCDVVNNSGTVVLDKKCVLSSTTCAAADKCTR